MGVANEALKPQFPSCQGSPDARKTREATGASLRGYSRVWECLGEAKLSFSGTAGTPCFEPEGQQVNPETSSTAYSVAIGFRGTPNPKPTLKGAHTVGTGKPDLSDVEAAHDLSSLGLDETRALGVWVRCSR